MTRQQLANFAKRLALSTAGPMSVAAANFLVSLFLLASVSPADFGLYSFIQVLVTGIGYGVSNAVLGSPLMIALNRDERPPEGAAESFALANVVLGLMGAILIALALLGLGATVWTSIAFAASAFLLWLRWFGRTFAFVWHRPQLAASSDLSYSAVLVAGVLFAWWKGGLDLELIASVQAVAALAGFFALGYQTLRVSIIRIFSAPSAPFWDGIARHGRHALVGVLSTEATANGHAYIVTLMLGPAAFAPLAAAALFFRPIPLVLQSLNQLERPVLAGMLKNGDRRSAWQTVSLIRISALGAWAGSVILAIIIIGWFLRAVLHEAQDPAAIATATVLWAAINLLRCLRGPESTLVQADGHFRPLSMATVYSSLVTLPLVAVLTFTHGAMWSLVGVLVGELIATVSIIRLARAKVAVA